MFANRKGFTLIELLVVVVIIGILAALAIPKFVDTKNKTYIATMKSDLHNFATNEEGYAADSAGAYFSGNGTAEGFVPSPNVSVAATAAANPNTWTATAQHSLTTTTCTMSTQGVIACS